jgi:hypothetical protein
MVTAGWPSKVSALSLSVLIALPPADKATRASLMVTGLVPNALEKRTRNFFPPMDTCTICRSVLPVKPGGGGRFLGSVNCGDVPQVPTQCSPVPRASLVVSRAQPELTARNETTSHIITAALTNSFLENFCCNDLKISLVSIFRVIKV